MIRFIKLFYKSLIGSPDSMAELKGSLDASMTALREQQTDMQKTLDKSKFLEAELAQCIEEAWDAGVDAEELTTQLVAQREMSAKLEGQLQKIEQTLKKGLNTRRGLID